MLLLAAQSFLPNAVLAVVGLIAGALVLFWLWMAVDCLISEPEATQKSAWLLVILFGNWIGALFYFFIRRRERLNPSRIDSLPTSSVRVAPPLQARAASVAMDAEVLSLSKVPPPAAPSSIARPSDWTLLRLLLIVFGVLVVLPTALVIVTYGVMLAMTFSAFRQDHQKMAEQRQAADEGYSDFQKRVAKQQDEFQKRVAVQQEEFQKRVDEQEAAHKKRASMGKVRAEPTGNSVTANTPLRVGDEVLCSWGPEWYRATVLEIQPGGNVKIHWNNLDDFFDEVVPRERLQLPAAAGAEAQADAKSLLITQLG